MEHKAAPEAARGGNDNERKIQMPTGFGFIAPDAGGNDIFVHISAVERAGMTGLADNQKISYELREGRDGRESASELQAI